jgi:hypothetical protein
MNAATDIPLQAAKPRLPYLLKLMFGEAQALGQPRLPALPPQRSAAAAGMACHGGLPAGRIPLIKLTPHSRRNAGTTHRSSQHERNT